MPGLERVSRTGILIAAFEGLIAPGEGYDQAQLHSDRSGSRIGKRSSGSGAIRRGYRHRRLGRWRHRGEQHSTFNVVAGKLPDLVTNDVLALELIFVQLVADKLVTFEPKLVELVALDLISVVELIPVDIASDDPVALDLDESVHNFAHSSRRPVPAAFSGGAEHQVAQLVSVHDDSNIASNDNVAVEQLHDA
jgi:hypothetical protein